MHKIWLVAKETYRREVKTWSYLFMILAPFIMVFVIFGIGFMTGSGDDSYVGVVTDNAALRQSVKKSNDFDNYASVAKAKKAYHNDDIDGYVVVQEKDNRLIATYHSDEKMDDDLKSEFLISLKNVQQNLNLKAAKLSAKQLQALSNQVDFKQTIKQSDGSADNPVQEITFFILIFLLYFLVLTYVQVTAQDIATEKGTKMMEVIFSSMPGGDYFTGKILGIFGEIITQVLIYALGLAGCYYAAPYIGGVSDSFNKFKPMIDQVVGNLLSWGLLFTVLALVLFIIFAAFCGALTVKSENANKAVSPLTTVGIVGFLIAINLQSAGDPIWAKILSYVPFLSSFIMPMRVLKGNATGFEAGISAVAALLAIVISFMWIRRIYPKLILQTDDLGPWQNFKRGLLN